MYFLLLFELLMATSSPCPLLPGESLPASAGDLGRGKKHSKWDTLLSTYFLETLYI
jgi:hypothetical protein